jgi:hypothetical protein
MRIFLLFACLFVMPVVFMACIGGSCGLGGNGGPAFLTYSKIETRLLKEADLNLIPENDTVSSDTVYAEMLFTSTSTALKTNNNSSNPFLSMACDVPPVSQKNHIKSMVLGLAHGGDLEHLDTSISNLINFQIFSTNYNWVLNRQAFLSRLQGGDMHNYLRLKIVSPHNSKDFQLVVWAIKESGDTIKSVSQKVFCK